MYAKLENGAITVAPKKLDGKTNPKPEVYYKHGYSDVILSEKPAPYGYEPAWEQTDEHTITQIFIAPDPDFVSDSEALAELLEVIG